jgi:dienelactone hydrolase
VEELIARLAPAIRVYKPDGPGPFPAVLQIHGCAGALPLQDEYARAARDAGVLAVILDSLTPRGIGYDTAVKLVCRGYIFRGRERAGDVVAGLEILRRRPDVDKSRLAVAGWSHGAWSIMDLLALDTPREKPFNLTDCPEDVWAGVVGLELIYPYSGFPALTRERGWKRNDIPADVLLVEGDTIASETDSVAALAKARAGGAKIDVEIWPGVTHGFEEEGLSNPILRYDPGRTSESHKRYAAWLKRIFKI